MTRNPNDIPEIFRRFLEEQQFGSEGGGEGEGPRRPALPPIQPFWNNRLFWVGLVLFILLISFRWIVTTYTEWLWFTELNYESVWLRQWGLQVGTFVVFFALTAVFLLTNWHIARRQAVTSSPPLTRRLLQLPGIGWLLTGGALFLAYIFGVAGSVQWDAFLRYLYRVPFGVLDPIFERDVSFYLFEWPIYRFLQSWAAPLTVVALLGVAGLYAIGNLPDIRRGEWQPQNLPSLRRHVAVLLAIFLGLWAWGYYLDIFALNYSPRGVVVGASYTDIRASLPALWSQMALMALLALAVLYNAVRFDWRPVAAMAGLWLAASLLLGGVYPAFLQRYDVEPNELARERPYIEHNIRMTRLAFGLEEIVSREFGRVDDISAQDLAENDAILRNIRLWDYRPLQQSYAQLQELRPYYEFADVDIDRYEIDGEMRQVMLAGRELNKSDLPAQSWVNRKLEFTHGYGIVMNPVNRFTADGQPEFFIKDLPPQSSIDLTIDRPEIYYGEMTDDIVFVGSDLEEFDYPSGNENVYSSYSGAGGVPLGNILQRFAFAFRFGELNLMLSEYITPDTRVMFHRQIAERARRIAPFLALDGDPYIVAADGRLVWVIDAYTTSRFFPYATPADEGFNYIRNAVKLTIDAYDGTVTFYLNDPDDPLIQAYAGAFPDLLQPLDAMPPELREHLRYPEGLFRIQTEQYLTYHMTEAQVFYNQEDLWEIPNEIFDSNQIPIEPYYVISELPGEEEGETEFLLIQPYTPARKNNMIAWIAARSDPPNYGSLVAYELPKQELVFGPIQVEGRIDQDPSISQQISLWNQQGSRVIRGNLLVIPINDAFLYVEPLYLLSDTSALPELKRVIVASGNRVVMRETLAAALSALVDGAPVVDDDVTPIDGQTPPLVGDETVSALVTAANGHFLAAEAAQRDGDWATYGRELAALEQTLQQLQELLALPEPETATDG